MRQATLFDPNHSFTMTISEVAETLSVSEASVRNWIKTGYLNYNPASGISQVSFDHFRQNVAGKSKLTGRANKSLVDEHDHEDLSSKTLHALEFTSNLLELSNEYQDSLSNSYRNKEGIYYTPENICETMLSDITFPLEGQEFCDPCCGSGNFIMAAIRHGFAPDHVYGYDTDPTAIEIVKQRILQETGFNSENIVCANFLEVSANIKVSPRQFDVIITNPPWGKKIQKSEKEAYGKILQAGRSLDTSSLFFFGAVRCLRDHGFLSFLMPDSFFKIATFQDARRHLLEFTLLNVRDFGKPFKGLLTKAQSFCLRKTLPDENYVQSYIGDRDFKRKQETFMHNPGSIINFESSQEDDSVIARLFDRPHIFLEGHARWGIGIVTGNNRKFCKSSPGSDLVPVYKGVDIHKGHVDEPRTFIPSDLSLYQQVAPIELFEANSKIIYRFISSSLVFFNDTEKSYFLNSVNMIVLLPGFPISDDNLVKLLNTELFSWLFSKLFNTHKILRADLEKLPLPVHFPGKCQGFTESQLIEYYELEKTECGTFRVRK